MSHHDGRHHDHSEHLDSNEVGYFGRVQDPTPNEHYTVPGVLEGKPVPETQPLEEAELPPLAVHHRVGAVDEGEAKAEAEEKARQEAGANAESTKPHVGRRSANKSAE